MSDKYYRGLRNFLNDTKYKLQLASMTLKINENKNNINEIKNDISGINNFSDKINDNETNISSNLSKLNNIENNLILVDDIYNETFPISRFSVTSKDNRIFYRQLYSNFTTNGIIKIDAKYNYVYDENYTLRHVYRFYNNGKQFKKIILDHDRSSNVINDKFEIQGIDSNRIDIAIYYENNTDSKKIELVGINTIQINYIENKSKLDINKNNISSNSGLISTNTSDIESNLEKIGTNTSNISDNLGKIDTNTSNISDNSGLISTNTSNIESNLLKINKNTDDITALQNVNIKAFYNLDKIFIYDIDKGYKTVDKDNQFHIFEKEITHNFIRNSYLEIALKVLSEISNYILIGYFQILCNFYNQDNNLFYTISLSTAMGSINKLSTIKSVFIVPINENMSKMKIDFFIEPKPTQQNRSARFTIQDINSNKIYLKYFQKTDEMSIKDIQDSLDNVKDISNDLEQKRNSIKLKNIYNILIYDKKTQIDFKNLFYEKVFDVTANVNDFIEIAFKIELEFLDTDDRHYVKMICELSDENDNSLYVKSVKLNNYIRISFKMVIDENIFYNFNKNIEKLKVVIKFQNISSSRVIKIFYIKNDNYRLILKHYGN